jgi:hypothetical protein
VMEVTLFIVTGSRLGRFTISERYTDRPDTARGARAAGAPRPSEHDQ